MRADAQAKRKIEAWMTCSKLSKGAADGKATTCTNTTTSFINGRRIDCASVRRCEPCCQTSLLKKDV